MQVSQNRVPLGRFSTVKLNYIAVGLSFMASIIHGLLISEHFDEWFGYGIFFALATVSQMMFAAVLAIRPWMYDQSGGSRLDGGNSIARTWYLVGIIGNLAIIGLYVITRTYGIPLFGPEAGAVEPITAAGVLSKLTEAVLVAVLFVLAQRMQGQVSTRPVAPQT